MRYVFDIETNGLLDQVTKIHCIVAANLTTRKLEVLNGLRQHQ